MILKKSFLNEIIRKIEELREQTILSNLILFLAGTAFMLISVTSIVVIFNFHWSLENISAILLCSLLCGLTSLLLGVITLAFSRKPFHYLLVMPVIFIYFMIGGFSSKYIRNDLLPSDHGSYIGFTTRATDQKELSLENITDERGSKTIIVEEFTDPKIKGRVVKYQTDRYNTLKAMYKAENSLVMESSHMYWQTAVLEGFFYQENSNNWKNGFYGFLNILNFIIPIYLSLFIFEMILLLLSNYKLSMLDLIFHRSKEDPTEMNKNTKASKFIESEG